MTNPVDVINLGLGKIAANRVNNINPPKSPIERHNATGYPTWRGDELTKRTWYFAIRNAVLTLSPEANPVDVGDGRVYRYATPGDMLRPIRNKQTRWVQRGKFVYHDDATLTIEYIADVPESDWPPYFRNTVACRVAMENVEYASQSNTKGDTAEVKYEKSINAAASINAFVGGPSDIRTTDEDEWLQARMGTGVME